MYKNHIFLNLQGTPTRPDSSCLSHGHGHYAYISIEDDFIRQLFREMSMWSGSTDKYVTNDFQYIYMQYELDCRDKAFFKSDSFKKLCHIHHIDITIFDDGDDDQIIRDFWEQVKRW